MSTHNGPPSGTLGYEWLYNGPTIDEAIPSLGKSLVGPPIRTPRPEYSRSPLAALLAAQSAALDAAFLADAETLYRGHADATDVRGLEAWIPVSEPSFAQEVPTMSSILTEPYKGIDRSTDPNPILQLFTPRFPYRPCSLPEQLPAKDALALLAVSRDADEEHPNEHAPGSRGHLLRREVGCDFSAHGSLKNGKPSRAKARRGHDRRGAWARRGRRLKYTRGTFQMGPHAMSIVADPNVPPDRMYSINPARVLVHPTTYAALVARSEGGNGSR